MIRRAEFLRPTLTKGMFLLEWDLFILLDLLRGDLTSDREVLVASYPLVFLYLVGCALASLDRRRHRLVEGWRLLALTLGLIGVDQIIKTAVVSFIPFRESVPIVAGWLHLAHAWNVEGSWLLSTFGAGLVRPAALAVVVVPVLLCSPLCYRYYVRTQRGSVWTDAAFVALFAGVASWVCDMALRGHVVDYINLPGVVAADLKDILLTVGAAALAAEVLETPGLSWGWRGWSEEARAIRHLLVDIVSFTVEEWRGARGWLAGAWRKARHS